MKAILFGAAAAGRATIKAARDGYPKPILESVDINAI